MKQLYFYVFDVIMLFDICLPSWPNINTFCTKVDRESFSVFRIQKSGHLCPKSIRHPVPKEAVLTYQSCFVIPPCLKSSLSGIISHPPDSHGKILTSNKQEAAQQCHAGKKGEYKYSSTLSLTSALVEVGGQRQPPTILIPVKSLGLLTVQEAGWDLVPVWRGLEKWKYL